MFLREQELHTISRQIMELVRVQLNQHVEFTDGQWNNFSQHIAKEIRFFTKLKLAKQKCHEDTQVSVIKSEGVV